MIGGHALPYTHPALVIDSSPTDARQALLTAHVGDDMPRFACGDARHRRHVTKIPVVMADAFLHRHIKCHVTMVIGFIDNMHQGRPLIGALAPRAVTAAAELVEQNLSPGCISHESSWRQK